MDQVRTSEIQFGFGSSRGVDQILFVGRFRSQANKVYPKLLGLLLIWANMTQIKEV